MFNTKYYPYHQSKSLHIYLFFYSGTQVLQVYAKDDDGDTVPSGKVTYSIVSTHNKFNIDKETGWLTTNAVSLKSFLPNSNKINY